MLKAVPLAPPEILEWAKTIERLLPGLDALMLCWLVEQMMTGKHPYDKNAGIQNLIHPIANGRIERTKTGYEFKTDFPG